MEEKSSKTRSLPTEAQDFIERIARKCSWRRSIRKDVRRELTAHFEDALTEVEEVERDTVTQALVKDFGDPVLLATLIGRGKRRCQPWWERALIMSVKVTAVLLVFVVAVDVVLSKRSGEALQNEIARIRSTGAPTSVQEVIEQAQKDSGTKALSKEERLKRCPATALLYELSRIKINVDTEVRGKRIFAMDRSAASMAQVCDSWDDDTAAAVDGTMSRNREVIEKLRALAALPPDDPADTIWFETRQSPEKNGESGVSRQNAGPAGVVELLAGPPDLLGFLDASYLMTLDTARAFHEQGPDAALDNATTIMILSNHVEKACHTVVGTMVAIAIRSIAMTSIVQPLLNRADVSAGAETRFLSATGQVNCSDVLAMSLAWERMFLFTGLKMIEHGEHIFATENSNDSLFLRLCKTPLDPLVLRARLFPFLHNADAMTALGFKNRLVEAAALSYPEYKARTSTWLDDLEKVSAWVAPITKLGMYNLINIKDDTTTSQANEDLALVAFALRRFKVAQGAYPDCLQALEPAFLPKVPADRFSGGPLLYRRQEEGCVIYSVFLNLRDDGGKDKAVEDNGASGDLVWKLTR